MRAIRLWWLAPLALAAGACTQGKVEDPSGELETVRPDLLEPADVAEVEESSAGIRKQNGGTNGDGDYCNFTGAPVCVTGEGDCDSNAECAGGNVCATDFGGAWGQNQRNEICVPPTCVNGTLDTGEGPEADCGGSCGNTCACTPTLGAGHADRCTYGCRCPAQVGDCDADNNCLTSQGLVCVNDVGARFGWAADIDVCLLAQCRNRIQEPNELAGIDVGGPCGPLVCPGPEGGASFCTPSCPCTLGQGDCDTNLDCAAGLVCTEEGAVDRCRDPFGPPPGGPVHCWLAEGNAQDSIGTNHGLVRPGTGFAPGVSGQAFSFSGAAGANAGVTTSVPPSVNGLGSFTYDLFLWVDAATPGSVGDGSGSYFIDRTVEGSPLFDLKAVGPMNYGMQVRYSNGSGLGGPVGPPITFGVFRHVALVRELGVAFRLYVGGALVGSTPDSGLQLAPDPIKLGAHDILGGGGFTGRIDSVRIFNRALSPAEVATAAAGNGGCFVF